MSQLSLPVSDVSNDSWTPASSPPVTLFNQINVSTSGSTNYVTSASAPSDQAFECKLDPIGSPAAVTGDGDFELTVYLELIGTGPIPVRLDLVEGSSLIASSNVTPTGSFQPYTITLTQDQIESIQNYQNLRVRVTANPFVQTNCCTNTIPLTLYLTFTDATDTCTCFNGVTVQLNWDHENQVWSNSSVMVCSGITYISLKCESSSWIIEGSGGCNFGGNAIAVVCSPLALTMYITQDIASCCHGVVLGNISQ